MKKIKNFVETGLKSVCTMLFCAAVSLFLMASPIVSATDIDVLDVKTTFKVGGVDKTKVVTSTATGTAFAKGVASVTGSSTISSGLSTVTAVFVSLTVVSDNVRYACGTSSGSNITLKAYGIGIGTATVLSTTETPIEWLAIGTP